MNDAPTGKVLCWVLIGLITYTVQCRPVFEWKVLLIKIWAKKGELQGKGVLNEPLKLPTLTD